HTTRRRRSHRQAGLSGRPLARPPAMPSGRLLDRRPCRRGEAMTIQRAIPDVQSEDIEATRGFYVDLLGFEVTMEVDNFLLLGSRLDPNVQLSVNGTPAGVEPARFAIDVGSGQRAREIYDEAVARGVTIVEEI